MKIAIIGLGYIGKVHLSILKSMPGNGDIVLVDQNLKEAREVAAVWGIKDVRTTITEIYDDAEISVVHNCTPNHLHYDINKKLLLSGKHILSEKPLCLRYEEAEELCKIAEEHHLVTGVNFCYRYYPAVQEMAARISKNEIGSIRAVYGSFFQDWLFRVTDYSWRLDPAFSGISNALGDIGSHWCDLAEFVTGYKIEKLIAETTTVHPIRKKPLYETKTFSKENDMRVEEVNIQLEDYGSVIFRLENGAPGSYSVGQICAGHKVDIDIKIFGSEGSVSWSHRRPEQLIFGHRDTEQKVFFENPLQQDSRTAGFARLPSGHPMGYHDAIFNLFSEFYQQVESGERIHRGCPDSKDGKRQIKIVGAAVQSHKEKSWTTV